MGSDLLRSTPANADQNLRSASGALTGSLSAIRSVGRVGTKISDKATHGATVWLSGASRSNSLTGCARDTGKLGHPLRGATSFRELEAEPDLLC